MDLEGASTHGVNYGDVQRGQLQRPPRNQPVLDECGGVE